MKKMEVPLLDLKAQHRVVKDRVAAAVAGVFESQQFILGTKVRECEEAIARYCGCDHAVGVSSGTDALLAALMAENIGPGDEVITSTYSFFATAGSIARVGARPVFVDVDPVTFNLNPGLIEAKITSRTRALIPVHLYGQLCDMTAVMAIARKHNLLVIEDACQAIGARHAGGNAGSIGHYGCLSFFPSKNLGCAGDGGMVLTNDAGRAAKIAIMRAHGSEVKYYHKTVGGNFRLDALQAAVLTVKLDFLDAWTDARRSNAARYDRIFTERGLSGGMKPSVQTPVSVTDWHVFNQYVLRVQKRDALREFLRSRGVGSEVYYPVPLHLQECFRNLGGKPGDCPESEKAAAETLALPVYPELTDEQAVYVVDCIAEFVAG